MMKYLRTVGCAALLLAIGAVIAWSHRETDLIDFIGMPQEKLVEKFGLEEITSEVDRNNQIVSYREDGDTISFWKFSKGDVVSIFMQAGTNSGYSLAGYAPEKSMTESRKLYENNCSYDGEMYTAYSGMELEKQGILQVELAVVGSGEILGVNADVCNEKRNLYTNRRYVWSEKCLKQNDMIMISYPQIEITDDKKLTEQLNALIFDGLQSKLSEYHFDIQKDGSLTENRAEIDYKVTFESGEYISIHYTGTVQVKDSFYRLDFGNTFVLTDEPYLAELHDILNDKVFGQYPNSKYNGLLIAENEEAAMNFKKKDRHVNDFYMLPTQIVCNGITETDAGSEEKMAYSIEYDTVSLLRYPIIWSVDGVELYDEGSNSKIIMYLPFVEVDRTKTEKDVMNSRIETKMMDLLQEYGVDIKNLYLTENMSLSIDSKQLQIDSTGAKCEIKGSIFNEGEEKTIHYLLEMDLQKKEVLLTELQN